ncbi:hypothetical protein C8Q79DRAFT_348395 [Trametes meyenii]|nr:hypothetical protein C8Q79DRAFT_348395 [Trametes meyenii]
MRIARVSPPSVARRAHSLHGTPVRTRRCLSRWSCPRNSFLRRARKSCWSRTSTSASLMAVSAGCSGSSPSRAAWRASRLSPLAGRTVLVASPSPPSVHRSRRWAALCATCRLARTGEHHCPFTGQRLRERRMLGTRSQVRRPRGKRRMTSGTRSSSSARHKAQRSCSSCGMSFVWKIMRESSLHGGCRCRSCSRGRCQYTRARGRRCNMSSSTCEAYSRKGKVMLRFLARRPSTGSRSWASIRRRSRRIQR